MMRKIPLLRVVTGAITAYTAGTCNAPTMDTQGNQFVSLLGPAGTGPGSQSSGTQNPLIVSGPLCWTLTNAPAVNTIATDTRAAGGAGVRHVLTSLACNIINVTNANLVAAAPVMVIVRDGASGVGPILFQYGAIGQILSPTGLFILGSPNTAMTVEFNVAPGATNFEVVSATGFSIALA